MNKNKTLFAVALSAMIFTSLGFGAISDTKKIIMATQGGTDFGQALVSIITALQAGEFNVGSVDTIDILDGTILAADHAVGSVDTTVILNATITNADMAAGAASANLGLIRANVVSDLASIAAGTCLDTAAFAATSAVVGDLVQASSSLAALTLGLQVGGYVSSAGNVTVRVCNESAGAIDPASATYKVVITPQ